MINIILCEDNPEQLNMYQMFIKEFIASNNRESCRLALSTTNPSTTKNWIANFGNKYKNIFILDIEFAGSVTTGIDLALFAKSKSQDSIIIFISTHDELMDLSVHEKIHPLDYILKETGIKNIKNTLIEDLHSARALLLSDPKSLEYFTYSIGSLQKSIPLSSIDYFIAKSNSNKVEAHSQNISCEFLDTIDHIKNRTATFQKVNDGLLINNSNVESYDKQNSTILFKDSIQLSMDSDKK